MTRMNYFGWYLEIRSSQRLFIGGGEGMRPMSTLAFGGLTRQSILLYVMLSSSRLATNVAARSLR